MEELSLADAIGAVGVSIVIVAYFLLQIERLNTKGMTFSLLNVIGSLLILYSLMHNWNFASVLIEVFWILISLLGIIRYYIHKKT